MPVTPGQVVAGSWPKAGTGIGKIPLDPRLWATRRAGLGCEWAVEAARGALEGHPMPRATLGYPILSGLSAALFGALAAISFWDSPRDSRVLGKPTQHAVP